MQRLTGDISTQQYIVGDTQCCGMTPSLEVRESGVPDPALLPTGFVMLNVCPVFWPTKLKVHECNGSQTYGSRKFFAPSPPNDESKAEHEKTPMENRL